MITAVDASIPLTVDMNPSDPIIPDPADIHTQFDPAAAAATAVATAATAVHSFFRHYHSSNHQYYSIERSIKDYNQLMNELNEIEAKLRLNHMLNIPINTISTSNNLQSLNSQLKDSIGSIESSIVQITIHNQRAAANIIDKAIQAEKYQNHVKT